MRVALHPGDECRPQTVDRERASHQEGLAGRDIGVQFRIIQVVGEGHAGARDATDRPMHGTVAVVDHPVAGVQRAGGAAHPLPALPRDERIVRFAVDPPIEFEQGIPAQDDSVDRFAPDMSAGNGFRFGAREHEDSLRGGERSGGGRDRVFVDSGRHGDRFDPGGTQCLQPRGRRRGEVEPHRAPKLS